MRYLVVYFACAAVAAAPPWPATTPRGEVDNHCALLAKAVEAHGGRRHLKKKVRYSYTAVTTTWTAGELDGKSESEVWFCAPDKYRSLEHVSLAGGKQLTILRVANGERFWRNQDGITVERTSSQMPGPYLAYLALLLPLLDDPALTISPLPDAKVGSRNAWGIQVRHKGRRPVSLFFDRRSHLLLKVECELIGGNGEPIKAEVYESDYRPVKRILWPMKRVYRFGPCRAEQRTLKVRLLNSIDTSKFAKP
jgi:hypothetical protein